MRITELSTLRQATQTALFTTQVAGWQWVGKQETGSVKRLHLFKLSPHLNGYYKLQYVYMELPALTPLVFRLCLMLLKKNSRGMSQSHPLVKNGVICRRPRFMDRCSLTQWFLWVEIQKSARQINWWHLTCRYEWKCMWLFVSVWGGQRWGGHWDKCQSHSALQRTTSDG